MKHLGLPYPIWLSSTFLDKVRLENDLTISDILGDHEEFPSLALINPLNII